jgi:hypothetical protein
MSFVVLTKKPSVVSIATVAYIPHLVRIPDSVYSLSKLIVNHEINSTELINPNLNVLSIRASRSRSGGSATFIIANQTEILNFDLWCLFDDGSITPMYLFQIKKSNDSILFLECSLPSAIIRRLWYNRIIDEEIKIYLSTSKKLLVQGFLDIPWSTWTEENDQSLTLCTFSFQIELTYFIQWIEYHRLVGISKFVIYNTSTMDNEFYSIIHSYEEDHPALIDIIQWNYSIDKIQYDCFLRYGDISEWITTIHINEYLIPKNPYDNLPRLLTEQYGRHLQASVILENQEFCSDSQLRYTEKGIIIEKCISRYVVSNRSVKYFYRPRNIDYLSINRDMKSNDEMKKTIVLAHYPIMKHAENVSNCLLKEFVVDTTVRDRFIKRLVDEIHKQNSKILYKK